VGKSENLLAVQKLFEGRLPRNVVVFGGGTVGSYLAKILDSSNLNIKLVDPDPVVCENLCSMFQRVKVIIGDPTDLDFLHEEDIGRSDVVVACTESDEKNLLLSLLSKSLGAKKAISQVSKGSYMKLFEKVGVDVVAPKTHGS
jgi:trk system potassium uptake protein TrkA